MNPVERVVLAVLDERRTEVDGRTADGAGGGGAVRRTALVSCGLQAPVSCGERHLRGRLRAGGGAVQPEGAALVRRAALVSCGEPSLKGEKMRDM
ncbi:UNVERIFIED_CONTAM: hypothetical protein Sradi_2699300 [Sesamum radiatum]|uniref:Uncharacterized protein n=1 Tax=Sesamum radiatum TaxID=300843 RepID=A0AAW2S6M1_SESRA